METCNGNNSQYVAQKTRKTKECDTIYYYCNRSGINRVTLPNMDRKRKMKSQGSCRTGSACTSTIRMRKKNKTGVCSVKYIALHYGHDTQLQYLRLPRTDQVEIAEKLAKGVSVSRILESNRENISSDDLKRTDLLTKMDIANIKNSYNISINDGVRHPIDNVSVDLWVEEYAQNDSNTIFYKKQGDDHGFFRKSDFCLIFMNASQEHMLRTYGNDDIVCLDSTHGLNGYDFELSTILVVDEWGEGFPGACMFSNRKDSETFNFFFKKIKEKMGILYAKTFMTDITNVFYNAWNAVMGPAQHQIFCSWHVDHAWRSNLNKIFDKEKRETVYNALKVLQSEMEETTFLKELERFKEILNEDPDTASFGKYFSDNYANRYEQWAYVYRKSAGINTNMHLEAMHKCIKYFHLGGSIVRRLDKGVHAVNTYIRDKIVDRMIKHVKGKNTSHLTKIEKRHKIALTGTFHVTQEENIWQVKTSEGKIYIVSKNQVETTSCCELKCVACEVCIHTYSCICIDYFIKATMCKHIHYVNILNKNPPHKTQNIDYRTNNNQNSNEVGLHRKTIANTSNEKLIRMLLKQQCLEIMKLDLTDIDDTIIQHALKSQKNIYNLLKGNVNISKKELQPTTSTGNSSHEPANKKIKKQQNFFSTKKKKLVRTNAVLKSTSDQCAIIKSTLLCEKYILKSSSDEHNYA